MIAFAYTECGLSIEQFFKLSWYEWSLEIEKVRIKKQRDLEIWEGHAFLTRELMALTANVNRDSRKKPTPYRGQDFIKLSHETAEDKEPQKVMTPEEVERKFGKTLTDKINHG